MIVHPSRYGMKKELGREGGSCSLINFRCWKSTSIKAAFKLFPRDSKESISTQEPGRVRTL